jgi:hypothetical protein
VNRVSFNGGSNGVRAQPTSAELAAGRDRHIEATSAQRQHDQTARSNPQLRAAANHGNPPIAATPRAGNFSNPVPAQHAGGVARPNPEPRQGTPRPTQEATPNRDVNRDVAAPRERVNPQPREAAPQREAPAPRQAAPQREAPAPRPAAPQREAAPPREAPPPRQPPPAPVEQHRQPAQTQQVRPAAPAPQPQQARSAPQPQQMRPAPQPQQMRPAPQPQQVRPAPQPREAPRPPEHPQEHEHH